jgi:hypothetical protein
VALAPPSVLGLLSVLAGVSVDPESLFFESLFAALEESVAAFPFDE